MTGRLLTVDWDCFMPYINMMNTSYLENKRNIERHWYKMYLENKLSGKDITKSMRTGKFLKGFWQKIQQYFYFNTNTKVIISDSHKIAYDIVTEYHCDEVYNFDAHTDLGYGGLKSLDFEVNCANWLGKLLKDKLIKKAHIILSPYSIESAQDFDEINSLYNVKYEKTHELKKKLPINIIHICRSGAWTAPWLDLEFNEFINELNLEYEVRQMIERKWNIKNFDLAKQIECILF